MAEFDSGALKRSQNFSLKILEKLKTLPELEDVHVGGSISRREALPMSDVDLVYFGKPRNLKELILNDIDHVDNFPMTSALVERLFACFSPEVGFLDSRPLNGETHKYCRRHNEKTFLLNRFLWEYVFSRRFNERSDENGYNLKYSVGAYRDILLIDWFARFLNDSFADGKPEIIQSLDKIGRIIGGPDDDLLGSIEIIMLTKSAVLAAHAETPGRGRTPLNEETLQNTIRSDGRFAAAFGNDAKTFWKKYLNAKKALGDFLDRLFLHALETWNGLIYDHIRLALALALRKETLPVKALLAGPHGEKFPVLACLIADERSSAETLKEMAKKCAGDPGHFYTNRLIAKSPKTDRSTLEFLLEKSKFAIDEATDNRYRSLVENKLAQDDR